MIFDLHVNVLFLGRRAIFTNKNSEKKNVQKRKENETHSIFVSKNERTILDW